MKLLHQYGFTWRKIAEDLHLSYNYVRKLANRKGLSRPRGYKNVTSCPECGGKLITTQDDIHETVCSRCGYVQETDRALTPGEEVFGRALTHPLIWHRNTGTPESTVLQSLKKAGIIKRLSAKDLSLDDSYIVYAMELLAKQLMRYNLDYGETAKVAMAVRRKVRSLVAKEKISQAVNETLSHFFPPAEKPTIHARERG